MVTQKGVSAAPNANADSTNHSTVKVAVRVRPFNEDERRSLAQSCLGVEHGAQEALAYVTVRDKAFVFDKAFEVGAPQAEIFERIVRGLIDGCLDGYNATLLAYGQTGSGKTYTMGTCPLNQQMDTLLDIDRVAHGLSDPLPERIGVLPRAISYLFNQIESRRNEAMAAGTSAPEFRVSVQFVELYNEDVNDLLDSVAVDNVNVSPTKRPSSAPPLPASAPAAGKIQIHEDSRGSIFLTGVSSRLVTSLDETMQCLADGASQRVTAETQMNKASSRSHAIFTVHIRQQRIAADALSTGANPAASTGDTNNNSDLETLTAKFHFVDLAGSERLKRTGAVGDRAKEGISINGGLLALGNVISALGERARGKPTRHVPYRDSKLTRLLQDSLGGNSRTWMVACVSPTDRDFVETVNTLKYASRARDIQNRVTVNQDKSSAIIADLRRTVQLLEAKLLEFINACRCGLQLDFSVLTGTTPPPTTSSALAEPLGRPPAIVSGKEDPVLREQLDALRAECAALASANGKLTERNRELAQQSVQNVLHSAADANTNGNAPELEANRANGVSPESQVETMLIRFAQQREELHARVIELEAMRLNRLDNEVDIGSTWTARCTALSSNDYDEIGMLNQGDKAAEPPVFSSNEQVADADQRESSSLSSPCFVDLQADGPANASGNASALPSPQLDDQSVEKELESAEAIVCDVTREIARVDSQIAARERLLHELSSKSVEMSRLRDVYERRIDELQRAISETRTERDQAVSNMERARSKTPSSDSQVDALRESFRRRLEDLEARHAALLEARAKNGRLIQENTEKEKQLKRLLADLQATKQAKVALMRELESERNRARAASVSAKRTVDRLEKDKASLDGQVRTLQRAAEQKDALLKRKLGELEAMRKQKRQMAPAAALSKAAKRSEPAKGVAVAAPAFVPPSADANALTVASVSDSPNSSAVAQRLESFERLLASLIERRNVQQRVEQEMQVWINERDHLVNKLEITQIQLAGSLCESTSTVEPDLTINRDRLMMQSNRSMTTTFLSRTRDAGTLEKEVMSIRAQLGDAQERIVECQSQLIAADEPETECDRPQAASKTTEQELQRLISTSSPHEMRAFLELLMVQFCKLAASGGSDDSRRRDPLPPSAAGQYDVSNAFRLLNEAMDFVNRAATDTGAEGQEASEVAQWRESTRNLLKSASSGDLPTNDNAAALQQLLAPLPQPSARRARKGRRTAMPSDLATDIDAEEDAPAQRQRLDALLETSHDHSGTRTNPTADRRSSPTKLESENASKLPPNTKGALNRPATLQNLRPAKTTTSGTLPRNNTMPLRPVRDPSNTSPTDSPIDISSPSESPKPARKIEATFCVANGKRGSTSPSPSRVDTTFTLQPSRTDDAPKACPAIKNDGSMMGLFAAAGTLSMATFSAIHSNNAATRKRSALRGSAESTERGRFQSVQRSPSKSDDTVALECVHELVGHRHSVLDCWYSDDSQLLFTSGFEGVVKCWDMARTEERESILVGACGSGNSEQSMRDKVTHVRYAAESRALYCATADCVRLYDLRESTSHYVKAYFTNGSVAQSGGCYSADSRRHDTFVRGLALADSCLFAAAGATLRVWDTRTDQLFPKLYCSQKVMTIHVHGPSASTADSSAAMRVVAGCKDHNVRVFETSALALNVSTSALQPTVTLAPPHCDGIEALATSRDGCTLFSATRDACIRKWDVRDLTNPRVVDQRSNAHSDWIRGLALYEPQPQCDDANGASYLLSCSKDGSLQLWNTGAAGHHKMSALKTVRAHSESVNAVRVSRGGFAFTASNDRTARIWRVRTSDMSSAAL